MTRTEAVNKVLNIARAEIGYHEKVSNSQLDDKTANSGSANYTKYARDLDAIPNFYNGKKNGYAWCDMFHDWIHVQAWGDQMAMKVLCQPERSCGAGCQYSAKYYKDAGRWHTRDPQPGDQIFFYGGGTIGHTGIVESVANGVVTTIEGNTSDMVARRTYSIGNPNIAGYGRPRYELVCDGNPQPENGTQGGAKQLIRYGDKNSAVKGLQEKLISLGYKMPVYGADGEFGNETLMAVRKFQSENGLSVDGVVGEKTWNKIDERLALAQKSKPAKAVPVGETKTDEQAIWDRLYSYIGNAYGAAGVMGNFYAESGLRSNNVENSYENKIGMNDEQYTKAVDNGNYGNFVYDSVGYGLYQATYWSIKQHLLNYAKRNRKSIGDRDMQIDAFVDLMQRSYPTVWQALKAATSVRQASDTVLLKFERPRDQSEGAQVKRAGFGQTYYNKYAGNAAANAPTGAPATVNPLKAMLRFGSAGTIVKELQEKLISKGYGCGPSGADGKFGTKTRAAVMKFQADNGLEMDGIVGPLTWAALNRK